MIYYAGIGSRQTPEPILQSMARIATVLAGRGYVLRSGGAQGADTAFEIGCDRGHGSKEIFLPWWGFQGRNHPSSFPRAVLVPKITDEIAAIAHSVEDLRRFEKGVRSLKCRNVCQILGESPGESDPVSFVICYQEPLKSGGTKFAMRLAEMRKIPVWNLLNISENDVIAMASRFSG